MKEATVDTHEDLKRVLADVSLGASSVSLKGLAFGFRGVHELVDLNVNMTEGRTAP